MSVDVSRSLADAILALARATPGVAGVYARPGIGQLSRIVREGVAVVSGSGSDGSVSPIDVHVTDESTRIEFDVALAPGQVGPAVARAVAAAARTAAAASGFPPAVVDVRVVSLG
ncbi:hypothetical protein [Frondihabitans sp. VKM Ac-2883]|uniref:hypothetical protein n=1 Tax=Frondihabitans sp. VKM Ac-2883 TaxID=2783823 RepID=UPI00188CEF8E|nr:hypothetical protein [Frondihabitans sp. VKM Ac-2883]MBF4577132.1 hypothetical protein [Frondihabitans sp. VKM Ac-2883]